MAGTTSENIDSRAAFPADAEAIHRLIVASVEKLCAADYEHDQEVLRLWRENRSVIRVRDWLSQPGAFSALYFRSGKTDPVAVGLALRPNKIQLCYLAPGEEGKGLGSRVMDRLESELKSWRATSIELVSTLNAFSFYEKRGYILEREELALGKIRCYHLRKTLLE